MVKIKEKDNKCFALRKKMVCAALSQEHCDGYESCPFYKPTWVQEEEVIKAEERLSKLPFDQQQWIANKYYNGEMPWRE